MAKKRKIPAKKRLTKQQIRDRERALKGWDTRRKKQIKLAERKVENLKKARLKDKKTNARIRKIEDELNARFKITSKTTRKQLARINVQLQHEVFILRSGIRWVNAENPEWLRSDDTIALFPSRLRHKAQTNVIREALAKAELKGGDKGLRKRAGEIALIYNVPLREVFTLHYSP